MNNDLFQQARSAYVSRDYATALNLFTECLRDENSELLPGEMGLLYHQIGNCLVKLNDPNEAIHAYSRATDDAAYDATGAVNYNLGMVYASSHDYEDAAEYFQAAIDDPNYPTPYKAYMGKGNSMLKLGKSAEAGAAFRAAALDQVNPDPVKALLNLGVCFMALDRPMDAIASYESALQFDMSAKTRNKIFANMGQAYVAAGKMNKAVRAFESALADGTYTFNDAANVDYQRAVAAVAARVEDKEDEEAPVADTTDLSGLDIMSDGDVAQDTTPDPAFSNAQTTVMQTVDASQSTFFEPVNNAGNFEDWSKAPKKKKKNRGLKVIITLVLLLLVLVGGALFCYTQGYGYPMKEQVVGELFADPQNADVYAANMDDAKKQRLQDMLVSDVDPELLGEANEMSTAHVYVQAQSPEGGEIPYDITLVRDGIGWKVDNVTLYFASQNQ